MKKSLLAFMFGFLTIISFSQNCPVHVPEFTFPIVKPLVINQVIGGAGSCDPDGNSMSWSIDGVTIPSTFPYRIVIDSNNPLRMFIVVNNVTNANNTSELYTFTIRLTDSWGNFETSIIHVQNKNNPPIVKDQTF